MTAASNGMAAVPEIDSPRLDIRAGGMIASVFFLGILGWAALTPLDAGAVAQGVVAVSGNRQAVQHRDGGIVTALHVVEGQTVSKGDVLLQISASEISAAERGIAGEVIALLAQQARLHAERDGLSRIPEPAEFAAMSAVDRTLAADSMRSQQLLFGARRSALGTERDVLGQRVRQHSEQIGGLRHQMTSNREQHRLIAEELEGLRQIEASGFVSKNRIRAVERAAAELDGNYGALRADTARSSEAIGETRMEVVALDRQQMQEVAIALRDTTVRLDELRPRLVAIREQLARSIVRAPAGGRVVGLKAFTVGGVVSAGDTVMEIVPQDRALVIEARAAPTDADDLRIGMETQVRFSALQERNLPILKGAVSKVSADSFEDPRTGQHYFQIEVVVPPKELAKILEVRRDLGLRAGLPAEVMIPIRQRTALAYLVEPFTQSLWRAGREN